MHIWVCSSRSTPRAANQIVYLWVRTCVIQWAAVGMCKVQIRSSGILLSVASQNDSQCRSLCWCKPKSTLPVITTSIDMTNICKLCCAPKLVSKNSNMQIQNLRSRPGYTSDLLHQSPRAILPNKTFAAKHTHAETAFNKTETFTCTTDQAGTWSDSS